ncbi:hypothetical protein VTL71DRAFT_3478 [Oculimacula yallundae]|uniref:Uncharacterized protein n=1 Tax=Oculimacula yallundae TaxID=86028 RepID=A0ABR4C791_9HELO
MSKMLASNDISIVIRQPIEKAFAGPGISGLLYAANAQSTLASDFRYAFEQPATAGNPNPARLWHKQFDAVFSSLYDSSSGIIGPLTTGVVDSLGRWLAVRDRTFGLSRYLDFACSYVTSGDMLSIEKTLFVALEYGTKLLEDVRLQSEDMRTKGELLQNGINKWKTDLDVLRGSWIELAKEISKNRSSPGLGSGDWFPHLKKWSDFLELNDTSLRLCQLTLDRFAAERVYLETLPALLEQLQGLCFDLYGNLLASSFEDLKTNKSGLESYNAKVLSWLTGCPAWPSEDFTPFKQIKCGEVYNGYGSRKYTGDGPSSVYVENADDIQVGVSRLDFGCMSMTNRWGPLAIRVNVGDSHRADRVFDARNSETRMFDNTLAWLQIPSKLREKAQFSSTVLDYEGTEYRVFSDGQPEGRAQPIVNLTSGKRGTWWTVKFPKPYTTDNIKICPWFTDTFLQTQGNSIGIELVVEEVTREGFRMVILIPGGGWIQYARVNYVAFEENPGVPGFNVAECHLDVPQNNQGQPQNFSLFAPQFVPFPPGKFNKRPAIAAFMKMFWVNSHFNYRGETRLAVTRDGFVIQGVSWADTIVRDFKWQILAIADENIW